MTTKEALISLFEKNRGFFISGEYIAQNLGVSRTAVWKAVKKLQKEGYDITAITNRGYCLSKDTDILSVEGIKEHMSDYYREKANIEVFRTVDSTNNICRIRANEGVSSGYIAIASSQSSGRGRRGRTFYSPADTGVYVSFLLTPENIHGAEIAKVTTISAVAVCKAIEKLTDKKPQIKWVNDVFVDGRKVCGILSEASYDLEDGKLDCVVVGIGINLYPPRNGFPEALSDVAGSILETPGQISRNHLVAEVLTGFADLYLHDNGLEYVEEYRKRSFVIGKDIDVVTPKSTRRARALAINDDCSLQVRYEDGQEEALISGEISIRVSE
ncbi:MAG: biotin--[Mogibacterium sp.]|nr:biotin--[acetyl-CoA-carboxylase] ligase [Mogibacterium sp.]